MTIAVLGPAIPRDPLRELTPRELEILSLIAAGDSNTAICRALFLSEKTIETHVRNIFRKLGLPPGGKSHRRVLAVLAYVRARGLATAA